MKLPCELSCPLKVRMGGSHFVGNVRRIVIMFDVVDDDEDDENNYDDDDDDEEEEDEDDDDAKEEDDKDQEHDKMMAVMMIMMMMLICNMLLWRMMWFGNPGSTESLFVNHTQGWLVWCGYFFLINLSVNVYYSTRKSAVITMCKTSQVNSLYQLFLGLVPGKNQDLCHPRGWTMETY